MFKNKTDKSSRLHQDELVSISLQTLIGLAKPAEALRPHPVSVRARHSGGYVSRFKGRGMEFDEARLYQAGDDIRSIDWRVTARTGQTHTKIFREERERPVFISVDYRPAMHFATRGVFKSVQAAKLAGLLAWAAQHQGDRVGGQLFSMQSCQEIKPQAGRHGVLRFLSSLVGQARAMPDGVGAPGCPLEHALQRLSQHVRPGSLVYLISDFRGFNKMAENYLVKLAEHCAVVLIFVYDPLEAQLPTKGRFRFTDAVRQIIVDCHDTRQSSSYQQRFLERQQYLMQLAKKRGLVFVKCSTIDIPQHCLK